MPVTVSIHQITPDDIPMMEALLTTSGKAFDEVEIYGGNRPDADYLRRLLGSDYFIALAALKAGEVVGGLAAYELKKFEQARSEIYILRYRSQPACLSSSRTTLRSVSSNGSRDCVMYSRSA